MRSVFLMLFFGALVFVLFTESCMNETDLNYVRYYNNGRQVYEQHCKNCHADDGKGLAKLYPPLTDTLFLRNNKSQLACIVKYGLNDTVSVNGIEFNGKMPAESQMADIDIAAVITYITNSFGNKQGLYDVADAGADLKACEHLHENK